LLQTWVWVAVFDQRSYVCSQGLHENVEMQTVLRSYYSDDWVLFCCDALEARLYIVKRFWNQVNGSRLRKRITQVQTPLCLIVLWASLLALIQRKILVTHAVKSNVICFILNKPISVITQLILIMSTTVLGFFVQIRFAVFMRLSFPFGSSGAFFIWLCDTNLSNHHVF